MLWNSGRSLPLPAYSVVATLNCVTCLPLASARISGSRVRRPARRTLFTVHRSFIGRPTGHGPTLRAAGIGSAGLRPAISDRTGAAHPRLNRRLRAAAAPTCTSLTDLQRHCRAGGVRCPRGARAPVPRSPGGASTPPTIDRRRIGTSGPLPFGKVVRAQGSSYAETRRTGGTRGVGHGPSNGRRYRRRVGRGRSRSRVTSRATMSDRPRAGTRPAGLIARHRHQHDRLPGQRGAIVVVRGPDMERRATADRAPVALDGSAGPVHVFRLHGAEREVWRAGAGRRQ